MQDTVYGCNVSFEIIRDAGNIKTLSLDCFDTILWRKTAKPVDVFFALAKTEYYKQHGLTAHLRIKAEVAARGANLIAKNKNEVSLTEIYRAALPNASVDDIVQLERAELAAEIQHCQLFPSLFELVKEAKENGLRVIVVSDTYLRTEQLEELLFTVAPQLKPLIDKIYCSNEYGLSKTKGIFRKILPLEGVMPAEIIHIGDSAEADFNAPRKFGIKTLHLIQQLPQTSELLEAREQTAVQVLPQIRSSAPLPSLLHAQLASFKPTTDQFFNFGYCSLGPILDSFSRFIIESVQELSCEGSSPKVAFLMRDGYLPSKAVEAAAEKKIGAEINISRFTANAASLTSEDKIIALLAKSLSAESALPLTKQLLLPKPMADRILAITRQAGDPVKAFSQQILSKDVLKTVISNSTKFRKRIVKHIQNRTGVQPGDTLIFVDLGYNGTAQNLLKNILKEDLNVTLIGRYLLSAQPFAGVTDRVGLIDPSWADVRTIGTLTGQYIAAFEMLCTQNSPSTIDYNDDGEPLYSTSSIKVSQSEAVLKIQDGCIAYIREAAQLSKGTQFAPTYETLGHSAAIDLARLLYFPTISEIDCLANFQFDFNLGTDTNLELFDLLEGQSGMRRHGLAYMNPSSNPLRTHYPIELRYLDFSLSCTLFAQNKNGFSVNVSENSYRKEPITILTIGATSSHTAETFASPTFDGYFSAFIPLGEARDTAVCLGKSYSYVQIDAIRLIPDIKRRTEGYDLMVGETCIFDGISLLSNGLCEVEQTGMLFFPAGVGKNGQCVQIVYRPIAFR